MTEQPFSSQNPTRTFFILLISWFLIQLIWGTTLGLYSDEAYYYTYGTHLDWGFFDHPPMVGVFSQLGHMIIKGEIGVRAFNIVGFSLALWGLYRVIPKKDPVLFFVLVFSSLACHFLGLFNLPDGPLFLFFVFFLTSFKAYLEKDSVQNTLLLIVLGTGMVYSKYQGIIALFIIALANLHLLRRPSFWFVLLGILLLYLPHIFWQIHHNFPSVNYHMVGRNMDYKTSFTLDYVVSQLVFYFLLASPIVFWVFIKSPVKTSFERTLKALTWGFLGLFFVATFKGPSEVNWTWLIFVPLMYFVFNVNRIQRTWLVRLGLVSGILIMGIRVQMWYPWIPLKDDRTRYFRHKKEFVDRTMKLVGDKMLVANNYQMAGYFSFYSGRDITSLNVMNRANQFSLWNLENDTLGGQEAYYLNYRLRKGIWINDPHHEGYRITYLKELRFLDDIIMEPLSVQDTIMRGDSIRFKLQRIPRPEQAKLYKPIDAFAYYTGEDGNTDGYYFHLIHENDSIVSYVPHDTIPVGTYETLHSPHDSTMGHWQLTGKMSITITE